MCRFSLSLYNNNADILKTFGVFYYYYIQKLSLCGCEHTDLEFDSWTYYY